MSLEREVGEIHTKVDHIIKLVEKQNGRIVKLEDSVGRIRRLQAWLIGVFTSVGAGTGTVVSAFWEKFSQ